MTGELDKLLDDLKKTSREIVDNLKSMDVDKETTKMMKEAEKILDSLSDHIENKRNEMEEKGVGDTVKDDWKKVEDGAKEFVKDIEDLVK